MITSLRKTLLSLVLMACRFPANPCGCVVWRCCELIIFDPFLDFDKLQELASIPQILASPARSGSFCLFR